MIKESLVSLSEMAKVIPTLDRAEIRPIVVGSNSTVEWVGIWNTSKNVLETIVPKKYGVIIQHNVAVGSFLEVLRERDIEVKGYVRNFGGKVVLVANFMDYVIKDGSSKGVNLGVKITNTYSSKIGPSFTGIAAGWRGECENEFSFSKSLSSCFQKHERLADLERGMRIFVDRVIDRVPRISRFIEDARSDVFADVSEEECIVELCIKSKKRVEAIMSLIDKRDLTRYGLYNSFTNYATHVARDDSEYNRYQRVAEKILMNPIIKLMKVFKDE
jgi:hypothetical protein